jgi:hypothetical protein
MTNLDMLYETLREWRDRFPNILCISLFLFDDGEFRIRVDWKITSIHPAPSVTYSISEEEINSAYGLEEIGERILNEMERQYMLWEVGEE